MTKRNGMTLIEMLIAIAVFGVVAAGALTFLTYQGRAFRRGNDRLDVVQNLRYAAESVERDLRALGAHVPDGQPYLVYAGANAVAFHADYASNTAGDPWAVYYDPDLPAGAVTSIVPGQAITIPTSAFNYPAMQYVDGTGTNSPAELIVLYFTADGSTARNDDFTLMRQVNNRAPELVARNILRTGTEPFFRYFRLVVQLGQPNRIGEVPQGSLPWAHTVPLHLGPTDVGLPARIDSIRGVRVTFTSTNGFTNDRERQRAITRLVRLPNAGMAVRRTCGDEPFNGTGIGAQLDSVAPGDYFVRLAWNRSTDEGNGENDVMGYTIWRRLAGFPDWGDPYLSLPAGNPNYAYDDPVVTRGETYEYAIAAQDCTPKLSVLENTGAVTIPP
jgi:prepilin-type N-terminal cleavage/methylation domain-containing protein